MAVVSVVETTDSRSASLTNGVWKYVRSFLVETDNPRDGKAQIAASGLLPAAMSAYVSGNDSDPNALLKSYNITQSDESRTVWNVTCGYDTQHETVGLTQVNFDNPLLYPTQYQTSFRLEKEIASVDVNGDRIVNSAGFEFDPPLQRDAAHEVLVVERNEAFYNRPILKSYINAVNLTRWYGDDPYSWKCQGISAVGPLIQNGIVYVKVRYEFERRTNLWVDSVLDAGYTQKSGTDFIPILDDHGLPISAPWPLNGSGARLSNPLTGTLNYIDVDHYQTKDFNLLNLGV